MAIFNLYGTFFSNRHTTLALENIQEQGQAQDSGFSTPTLSNKKSALEAYYEYLRNNEGLSALWTFLEKNPAAIKFLLKDSSLSPDKKIDLLAGLSKDCLAHTKAQNLPENLMSMVDEAVMKKDNEQSLVAHQSLQF